jgi:hypothetical protein
MFDVFWHCCINFKKISLTPLRTTRRAHMREKGKTDEASNISLIICPSFILFSFHLVFRAWKQQCRQCRGLEPSSSAEHISERNQCNLQRSPGLLLAWMLSVPQEHKFHHSEAGFYISMHLQTHPSCANLRYTSEGNLLLPKKRQI